MSRPAKGKVNHRVYLDAILDDRDEAAPYLVYADALQAAGDPRGELIIVQEARARKPADRALGRAEDALLDANGTAWIGRAADHQETKSLDLVWKNGFLETASIREVASARADEIAKDLFACPSAAVLDTLLIESMRDEELGAYAKCIAKLKNRPPLRTLRISRNRRGGQAPTIDANALLEAFPQLHSLSLDGFVEDLSDDCHRLTALHIERPSRALAAKLKKKWPGLTRLALGKSWRALPKGAFR